MDYAALERVVKDSGLKKSAIADKIGTNRTSFYLKLNGEREFSHSEILMLKKVLQMTDRDFMKIFFDERVEKCSTKS